MAGGETTPQLSVYMRAELREAIESAAEEADISVSRWIREAARDKLDRPAEPTPASAD